MTKEKAIKQFETLLLHVDTDCVMGMETTEAINMAIKALEQPEPCENAVSRNLVLSEVKSGLIRIIDGDAWKRVNENVIGIKSLPPVTPKQRIGKWVDNGDPLMLTCGNCGYGIMRYNNTPFCPNCGEAKMEGVSNEHKRRTVP